MGMPDMGEAFGAIGKGLLKTVNGITFPVRYTYKGVDNAIAKTGFGQAVGKIPLIGKSAFGSDTPSPG